AYVSNLNRASIQPGDAGKIERIKEDESGWENVTPSEAGIATETYVDDKASLPTKGAPVREALSTWGGISLVSGRPPKPLVSFCDDDGRAEVMTSIKPIFDAKGIVGSVALPTDDIGTSGRMTWDDIRMLADDGWEILS